MVDPASSVPVTRTETGEAQPKRQRNVDAGPDRYVMRATDLRLPHIKSLTDITYIRSIVELAHACELPIHPLNVPVNTDDDDPDAFSTEQMATYHSLYTDMFTMEKYACDEAFQEGRNPDDHPQWHEQSIMDLTMEVYVYMRRAVDFIRHWE